MELNTCPKCDNATAKNARACPNCGHRFTSATAKGCLWIIVFMVVVTIYSVNTKPNKTNPKQVDTSQKINTQFIDDGKQPQRLAFINKLKTLGIISDITMPAKTPHVHVGANFYAQPFKDKQSYMNAILSYYIIQDNNIMILVIKDYQTGNRIGSFSEYGLDMD